MDLKNKILAIIELPSPEQDAALTDLANHYSTDDFKSSFSAIVEDHSKKVLEIKNSFVKEQLDTIAPMISFSYIAKHYFKKSKGWLSLKIKKGSFSDSELQILNTAIQDMSSKIAACEIGSSR